MVEHRIYLKLDRRNTKRRRILLVIPPMPHGCTLEFVQGTSRKADDYVACPKGTKAVRPK